MSKISELVSYTLSDAEIQYREINFSNIPNYIAQEINKTTTVEVRGATLVLSTYGITHAFSSHGDHNKEFLRGQIGIQESDFEFIPDILINFDRVEKGNASKKGEKAVLFIKNINNKFYHVVMNLKTGKNYKIFAFATMYIKKR